MCGEVGVVGGSSGISVRLGVGSFPVEDLVDGRLLETGVFGSIVAAAVTVSSVATTGTHGTRAASTRVTSNGV